MFLISIIVSSLNTSNSIQKATQANALVKEEYEAIRSFRDGTATTWASNGLGSVNFGINNPYYLFLDTGANPIKWVLNTGVETVDIFTRKVVFDKVSRDPSTQNIESSYNPLNNDPDTVKATITVEWLNKTSQVIAYFTNWQK